MEGLNELKDYPEKLPNQLLFKQELVGSWAFHGRNVFLGSAQPLLRTQKNHDEWFRERGANLCPAWALTHALLSHERLRGEALRKAFVTSTLVISKEGSRDAYVAHQSSYGSEKVSQNHYALVSKEGGMIFRVNDLPTTTTDLNGLANHPQTLEALFCMTPEFFEQEFSPLFPRSVFWPEVSYVFQPVPHDEFMDLFSDELIVGQEELPSDEVEQVLEQRISDRLELLEDTTDPYAREELMDEINWCYEELDKRFEEQLFGIQEMIDDAVRGQTRVCNTAILDELVKSDELVFRGENLGRTVYKTVVVGGFTNSCVDAPVFGVSFQEVEDLFPAIPVFYE